MAPAVIPRIYTWFCLFPSQMRLLRSILQLTVIIQKVDEHAGHWIEIVLFLHILHVIVIYGLFVQCSVEIFCFIYSSWWSPILHPSFNALTLNLNWFVTVITFTFKHSSNFMILSAGCSKFRFHIRTKKMSPCVWTLSISVISEFNTFILFPDNAP